ncbi:MAG: inorganic phosphate transporter, partial [Gammaproteobacteria bacterium]|nr:inorganic phosphate transporter [Gammaproteobacteria bacterium]
MSVATESLPAHSTARPHLDQRPGRATVLLFLTLLLVGVGFTIYSLSTDIRHAIPQGLALLPFLLLGVAL